MDKYGDSSEIYNIDKVPFLLMVPMNEISKHIRNALTYVVNIATEHYDSLTEYRYHVREIVLVLELLLQAWYLKRH